jgi:GT2 family glycosyltransferase
MIATVIVVTLNRPDCVCRCLEQLAVQTRRPDQVIVVDASRDDLTRRVVASFPEAQYLRNDNGYGRMTASRNIGLRHATGDVIAFVDDDAFAHARWLEELLKPYDDPVVGAVGGRVLNGQPGEGLIGVNEVGQLKRNGTHTGNFAADTGAVVAVGHVMGCNMSFRRGVLIECGGFREDYPGISGVREDTDMCLRVGGLGHVIAFNPAAVVDHLGAPQATGRRFDTRYTYYAARNHVVMLMRNYGILSPRLWRYVSWISGDSLWEFVRRIALASLRCAAIAIGTVMGLISGASLLLRTGRDPVRRDAESERIRADMRRMTVAANADAEPTGATQRRASSFA